MSETVSIIGKRCATIDEIREQVYRIIKEFDPEKIILFGSYAYGNPTPESDVDLLVIKKTSQPTMELSSKIALLLDHTFPFDIIVITPEQINRRLQSGDFFIEDVLNNGKLLYERHNQGMD
ncbi:MAG: nucleotidyltransferase domain-containing protein [Calditrichaeota bacterium]|nr:nucleotidyltransferase domain-containing protein [Calditrichota bacterium]